MEYLVARVVLPILAAIAISVVIMIPLSALRLAQTAKNVRARKLICSGYRTGKFVLFLRAFDSDEPAPGPSFRWSIMSALRQVDESGAFAPGTRFGRHIEGAARSAFGSIQVVGLVGPENSFGLAQITADNSDWKAVVAELCIDAKAIVFVVSGTPGLAWELRQVIAHEHLQKTVFVIPPWSLFRRSYGVASEVLILRARKIFDAAGIALPRPSLAGKVFRVDPRGLAITFERKIGRLWEFDDALAAALKTVC